MAPSVRTGGSRHTGLAALPHHNNHLPDLMITEQEKPHYGKYGMLRKAFLKQHRKGLYTSYLLTGKLISHLNMIDDQANERIDLLFAQMERQFGVNEDVKEKDQMAWITVSNNLQNAAEEIVLKEIVYY